MFINAPLYVTMPFLLMMAALVVADWRKGRL